MPKAPKSAPSTADSVKIEVPQEIRDCASKMNYKLPETVIERAAAIFHDIKKFNIKNLISLIGDRDFMRASLYAAIREGRIPISMGEFCKALNWGAFEGSLKISYRKMVKSSKLKLQAPAVEPTGIYVSRFAEALGMNTEARDTAVKIADALDKEEMLQAYGGSVGNAATVLAIVSESLGLGIPKQKILDACLCPQSKVLDKNTMDIVLNRIKEKPEIFGPLMKLPVKKRDEKAAPTLETASQFAEHFAKELGLSHDLSKKAVLLATLLEMDNFTIKEGNYVAAFAIAKVCKLFSAQKDLSTIARVCGVTPTYLGQYLDIVDKRIAERRELYDAVLQLPKSDLPGFTSADRLPPTPAQSAQPQPKPPRPRNKYDDKLAEVEDSDPEVQALEIEEMLLGIGEKQLRIEEAEQNIEAERADKNDAEQAIYEFVLTHPKFIEQFEVKTDGDNISFTRNGKTYYTYDKWKISKGGKASFEEILRELSLNPEARRSLDPWLVDALLNGQKADPNVQEAIRRGRNRSILSSSKVFGVTGAKDQVRDPKD